MFLFGAKGDRLFLVTAGLFVLLLVGAAAFRWAHSVTLQQQQREFDVAQSVARLFLISGAPLDAEGIAQLKRFISLQPTRGGVQGKRVLGVLTAGSLHNETAYYEQLRRFAFKELCSGDLEVRHVRLRRVEELQNCVAVFVAGGNTYALLQRLRQHSADFVSALARGVLSGELAYIGASAGSVISGPSILTTNDWNVVAYGGPYAALQLQPFCINAHYVEGSVGYGESRDDRIAELFLAQSTPAPVLAFEDPAILIFEGPRVTVSGKGKTFLFRKGRKKVVLEQGSTYMLSDLT